MVLTIVVFVLQLSGPCWPTPRAVELPDPTVITSFGEGFVACEALIELLCEKEEAKLEDGPWRGTCSFWRNVCVCVFFKSLRLQAMLMLGVWYRKLPLSPKSTGKVHRETPINKHDKHHMNLKKSELTKNKKNKSLDFMHLLASSFSFSHRFTPTVWASPVVDSSTGRQYTHFISVPLAHDEKFRQLVDQFREDQRRRKRFGCRFAVKKGGFRGKEPFFPIWGFSKSFFRCVYVCFRCFYVIFMSCIVFLWMFQAFRWLFHVFLCLFACLLVCF